MSNGTKTRGFLSSNFGKDYEMVMGMMGFQSL
jgi:hypothetical protein